jgi:hypothetical protein
MRVVVEKDSGVLGADVTGVIAGGDRVEPLRGHDHQVDAMADLFTTDALFQGFGPDVVVGRDQVRAYCEAVQSTVAPPVAPSIPPTPSVSRWSAGSRCQLIADRSSEN